MRERILTIVDAVWRELNGNQENPCEISYNVEEPPKNIGADFSTNVCMVGAKVLRVSPRDLAQRFVQTCEEKKIGADVIERVSIAGPGFINFVLKQSAYAQELATIIEQGERYGHAQRCNTRVIVEFVSANPTGPLHIGHARGAALGDSLARIFDAAGYDVDREYYVNNAGNQISILAQSVEVRLRQLRGETITLPDDCYKGDYIVDIARAIDAQFPTTPVEEINVRSLAVAHIMKTIEDDLRAFGVVYTIWFYESSLFEKGENDISPLDCTIEKLKANNVLKLEDGAWWLCSGDLKHDDKNRVVIRADGRPTYLATDIAYHDNKYTRAQKLIDIWGADHHGYVPRLTASVSYLGHSENSLTIVLYQLVSLLRKGERVAMSTRAGEFVTLKEVVDEVGKDACRFFLLMRSGDSPLEFDLDVAKQQSSENPVYYVQYAHARIASILRGAEATYHDALDAVMPRLASLLVEKEEQELMKAMAHFPHIICVCVETNSPHHITTYLLELAAQFHKFYTQHRVIDEHARERTAARLILCKAVASVIKNGLSLLGISAPEKM